MTIGNLFVVSTPIGNLSDITLRAIDTLKNVDIILCEDTRHSLKLLNHYEIKNKLISYHKFNEKERSSYIVSLLKEGKNIALISDAGTPCISDPGYILIREVKDNNIPVIPVGGISAVVSALSVCGLNTDNFTFYGFFPKENKDKEEVVNNIKNSDVNLFVFYESPKRIIKTLEYFFEKLGNIKISLSSDLTKLHEKNYYGNIEKVIKELNDNEKSNLGEYTLIIECPKEEEIKESISIEAMLIDVIVKNNITMKEAIDVVSKNNKKISKKDIYNASLNIKNL